MHFPSPQNTSEVRSLISSILEKTCASNIIFIFLKEGKVTLGHHYSVVFHQ